MIMVKNSMNLSSNKGPSLTVFCPLFKGEMYIQGYLEDMVDQTIFKEVSFYILDCNSPHAEFSVIEQFLGYSNIHYKRLDKDPGLYEAWNICCKSASTDLVGNWNVDDRKSPWSLESLRQPFILDTSLDISYGPTLVSDKPNESWSEIRGSSVFPCNETNRWEDLIFNNNPHCMPVWKKTIHDRFGYFDARYKTAADSDMWIRAVKGGAKIKRINDIVGIYFDNPSGRSTNPETLNEMLEEVHEMRGKHLPSYKKKFRQNGEI
jgi:hypothetical protein|tara:strand:+ start:1814 stop:2602 length:789 start_codon:yes stop_codon:yes gene_type:complete